MSTLPAPRGDQDYIMAEPVDQAQPQGSPIQLHKILNAIRRFWWVPMITLIMGLGVAAAVIKYMPATFVSKGRLVETGKLVLPEGTLFADDSQTASGTQSELLQSETMRNEAIAHLRSSITNVTIPLDEVGKPVEVPLRVLQSPKHLLTTIEATGSDPRYIHGYLNSLMTVYLRYKKNEREVVSGDTLEAYTELMKRAERDFNDKRDEFLALQRTNNLVLLQQESSTAGTQLAELKTRLSELRLEERLLQLSTGFSSTNAPVPDQGPNASTNLIQAGFQPTGVEQMTAVRDIEVLKIQFDRLSKNLKPRHPKMVKLSEEILRGEKLLAMYRDMNRAQLASSLQTLQLKIQNVLAGIAEWEQKALEANSRLADAEKKKLEVQRLEQVYDRLSSRLEDIRIGRSIDKSTLRILEPASAPQRTYSREIQVGTLGGMGGLGLGLGLIALVAWRDDRFGSVREVCDKLGNGVLGQVPEVALNGSGPLELKDKDQQHMFAESYRNVRSALLYLGLGEFKSKVILVASALPDEGKSTVAVNLAKTLALGGARVLLVDGDLRKGTLHQAMGLQQTPGLTELLHGTAQPDQVLQTNSMANLRFLASGHRSSQAGDLFVGNTIDQLLKRWREEFDHVIIDSTPIFAADDAATLAPKTDGAIFVVRNRFSRSGQVREALEVLVQRQAKVLGLVFNRANPRSRAYYYYKYKEYYAEKA